MVRTALVPVLSDPRHLKVVLAHVVVVIVPPLEVQVPLAMFTLVGIVTGDPTPCEATKVAHSFPTPTASPTAAPAAAAARAPRNCGRATADRIPTIATTIISSIRVKPFWRGFFFSLRLRISASLVLGEMFIGKAQRLFTKCILCTECGPVHAASMAAGGSALLYLLRFGTIDTAGV